MLTFGSRKKINKIKNKGKGLNKKILPLDIGKVNIQTKKPALGFISNLILDIKGTQQKGKYILLMAKHFKIYIKKILNNFIAIFIFKI